jgi:transposase-like protein
MAAILRWICQECHKNFVMALRDGTLALLHHFGSIISAAAQTVVPLRSIMLSK